ncbi:surface presentation of antigens protein SpaO [Striga asiatica]|uniref:Surface presentation of antigens protein SpaO n=1 Tax=Striga asiatica TaxID=4170 RepID=A0A5A7PJP9_STRAF|nr:surface presentation of antigens protein SpaO [Striga asiatica]
MVIQSLLRVPFKVELPSVQGSRPEMLEVIEGRNEAEKSDDVYSLMGFDVESDVLAIRPTFAKQELFTAKLSPLNNESDSFSVHVHLHHRLLLEMYFSKLQEFSRILHNLCR